MPSSSFLANFSGNEKKDENRRKFTDFKIVGFGNSDLSWSWGAIPTSRCKIKAESIAEELSSSSSACYGDTVGQVGSLPTKEESADLPRSFANARMNWSPSW